MSWSKKLQEHFMRPLYITGWNENENNIVVYVGHKVLARGTLHAWLSENGIPKTDYDTQFRNNSNHTMVIFFNKQMAFLFKMQFINEKTYMNFE